MVNFTSIQLFYKYTKNFTTIQVYLPQEIGTKNSRRTFLIWDVTIKINVFLFKLFDIGDKKSTGNQQGNDKMTNEVIM